MERLEQLTQRLLEGELAPDERAELDGILQSEGTHFNDFLHELEVEASLRDLDHSFDVTERVMTRIRAHVAEEGARRAKPPRFGWFTLVASMGHRPWRIFSAIAAVAAAVGAIFFFLPRTQLGTMTIEEGVSDAGSTQQHSTQGKPIVLANDSHVGLPRDSNASIDYRNGTKLQLGLEADMTFIKEPNAPTDDARHIRLNSGRLVADVPDQPGKSTFAIDTPQGTTTTMGAKLELFTNAKTTQVRVDFGVAHLERSSDHKSLDLHQGQYAVLNNETVDLTASPVLPLRCIFDDQIDTAAFWTSEAGPHSIIHQDSHTGAACLRITPQQGRVNLAGLALPIREFPKPGEFRFVTFAWRKDGGGRLALQFDHADEPSDRAKQGRSFGYRYDAGAGSPVDGLAMRTDGNAPLAWTIMNRDLWKDFGDFTLTGLTFMCPDGDAASFDSVYVARSPGDFTEIIQIPIKPDAILGEVRNDPTLNQRLLSAGIKVPSFKLQ